MKDDFLIVNKEILPDFYDKVIQARNYVAGGMGISDAVKLVGISRSTYYKYKDYIFLPGENTPTGRKAIISLLLRDEKGILSEVLNDMYLVNANILVINQTIPVNGKANVNMALDIIDLAETIDDMLKRLEDIDGVLQSRLIAVE